MSPLPTSSLPVSQAILAAHRMSHPSVVETARFYNKSYHESNDLQKRSDSTTSLRAASPDKLQRQKIPRTPYSGDIGAVVELGKKLDLRPFSSPTKHRLRYGKLGIGAAHQTELHLYTKFEPWRAWPQYNERQ
ncbi:hypothetical protein HaLaN_01975, partial [Haematococcus lacustris]